MQMMQTKQQSIQFQLQQQEKLRTKMQEQLKPAEETATVCFFTNYI